MSDLPFDRRMPPGHGLAQWPAARARNALRRVRLILTVGAVTGLGTLFLLQMIPREAERSLRARIAALPPATDTVSLQARLEQANDSIRAAQHALEALQVQMQRDSLFVMSVTDATGVPRVVVGDTLRAQLAERLQSARATPLVDGYLALAAAPALAADTLAQLLADSLRIAERERADFAALGGPDLRYRSLQSRVSELGERLAARAVERLQSGDVSSPGGSTLAGSDIRAADTTLTARQTALQQRVRTASDSANKLGTSLRRALEWNAERSEQERRLRAAEPLRVPLWPMLLAALSLAAASGYSAAFLVEWRDPRIADVSEVLVIMRRTHTESTVIEHAESRAPLLRRAVDRQLPNVLRGDRSPFRRVHLMLSETGDDVPVVGIAGSDADIAARVALNLSAAASEASRATLVVDTDTVSRGVSKLLEQPTLIGLAEAARGRVELASALTSVVTGRDQTVTVLPAGLARTSREMLQSIVPDVLRLMQRHDLSVLVLPQESDNLPSELRVQDTVVAVIPGITSVSWLRGALLNGKREGQRVRAVLLLPSEFSRPDGA